MASKGQKFQKWDDSLKEVILELLKEGHSYRELARKYNLLKGTISTWQQKLWHPEKYPGQGKKKGNLKEENLTKEDWKQRYEILKKYQAFLKAQREKK